MQPTSVLSARNMFNSKRSHNGNRCKDSVELVQQNRIIAISTCANFVVNKFLSKVLLLLTYNLFWGALSLSVYFLVYLAVGVA